MKTIFYAAAAVLVPFAAAAHDGMAVEDAYARSANPKSGAIFMLLENHRKVDCTLKTVSSDVAERVMLHSNQDVDGVMKMQEMGDGLTISAESEHLLQRGGDHVMLMGLKAPLEDGQTIKVSLDFGDCGTEEVDVPVDNQRQEGAEASDEGAHDHGEDHDEEHVH